MCSIPRPFSFAAWSLHTAFLFTKSDIKTTVIPIALLAAASAPLSHPHRLFHVVFWIWIYVLQFDTSNQTLDLAEDEINKKDRPIPAKRISYPTALRLRWILVPVCLVISLAYSVEVFYTGFVLTFLIMLYNELGASNGHYAIRNIVNASGFACFEIGATLIARDGSNRLDSIAMRAIALSVSILATTTQAQDFKDVDGDKAIGRRTIPIVFPKDIAQYAVIVPLSMWSLSLSVFWDLWAMESICLFFLAVFVGTRFFMDRSIYQYQVGYYWYNVWISLANALPALYRIRANSWIK